MVTVLLRFWGLSASQRRDLLLATDECGELWPRVQYQDSPRKGSERGIDLKIETECEMFAQGVDKVPVLRDVPDKLWEVIGIFPRKQKREQPFSEILEDIRSTARAILNSTDAEAVRRAVEIMGNCDKLLR